MNTDDSIVLLAADPATAYREYLYRPHGRLARWIDERFDVVARPGQRINQAPQLGDVLLEVTLGRVRPSRCLVLQAHDLQLEVSPRRLSAGQLLLRPRKRAEMSEPLPVEPAVETEDSDLAVEHEVAGADSRAGKMPVQVDITAAGPMRENHEADLGSPAEELLTEVTDTVHQLLAPSLPFEDAGTLIGRTLRDVAAKIAVTNALDHGERGENALTDAGFNARHPTRPVGPIRAGEPQFDELRADWLDVRSRIVRPALAERAAKDKLDHLVPRGRPSGRLCCLLWTDVLDPGSLGTQGDPSEALGEVFTTRLGFIDLGHARETADVTLWALNQIQAVGGAANNDIELFHGKARLAQAIPTERRLALAQQLAYVDAVVHEIDTFGVPGPGMDNSAFSPEDLTSNLFGTVVAGAAFVSDGGSNTTITNELKRLLTSAGAQPASVGRAAQAVAQQRHWWDAVGNPILFPLLKRNLTAVPWLIDPRGSARIQPSPLLVEPPFVSPDFTYESHTHVMNSDFQTRIDGVRSSLPASALVP